MAGVTRLIDNDCPDMHRSKDTEASSDRYERLLEVQTLMARVSRELGPALDLDPVLKTVLDAMRELVDCDGGVIALLEDQRFTIAAATPDPNIPMVDTRLDAPEPTLSAQVVASGQALRSDDVSTDPRAGHLTRLGAAEQGIVSFLCVPLVCLGDVIGTLAVHSAQAAAYDDEHLVLLEG